MQLMAPYAACHVLTFHNSECTWLRCTGSAESLLDQGSSAQALAAWPQPPHRQRQNRKPTESAALTSWCRVPANSQASSTAGGQACAAWELESDAHLGLLGWPSVLCLLLLRAALHRMQEHMRPGRNRSAPHGANKVEACRAPKGAIRTHKLMLPPGSCPCRRQACLGPDAARQGCQAGPLLTLLCWRPSKVQTAAWPGLQVSAEVGYCTGPDA